jgi:hypothetical protein
MKLVTFGDDHSKIKYLREPFINLGLGKQFKDTFSKLEALRECKFTDEELVCFVDGYDVMQFGDVDEIETKFKSFGADLVVGAEIFCWPSPWMAHLFPEVPTKYRFPNSGMYMGKWWAIKKMLEWDQYRLTFDDQGYFHDFYLRQNSVKIVQDHDCILFQNCVFVPWIELGYSEGGRVANLIKGTTPCFLHFSGKSDRIVGKDESVMDYLARGEPIGRLPQFPKLTHGL